MATYNKFNDFSNQLVRGTHNFASNTFRIMLTNSAPIASNTIKSNLTEIASGSGYPGTNTTTITIATGTPTATSVTISGTQVQFTASGAMATFQYAVLYNDTATNKNLIAWWDYGSAVNLLSGETFTVKFNNTDPGSILSVG